MATQFRVTAHVTIEDDVDAAAPWDTLGAAVRLVSDRIADTVESGHERILVIDGERIPGPRTNTRLHWSTVRYAHDDEARGKWAPGPDVYRPTVGDLLARKRQDGGA